MKKIATTLALLLGLASFSPLAFAEDFVFTGNEARAPKIFNDTSGAPQGVLIEVMKYVEKETGSKFSYKLMPFARAYDGAKRGELGIIGLSVTAERLPLFDYCKEPLFYDDLVLVVKAGKEFPFDSISDLKGKKIGTARGASYGEAYEQAVKEKVFEAVPGNTPGAQLSMLLLDRLDAVLISTGKAGLEEALKSEADLRKDREKLVILSKPFARDPNYLAFAKSMGKKDFLTKVDQALVNGNKSGAIPKLVDAYIASRR